MKTKVDIIAGFLGAGKTTLIKEMISQRLYNEKVVIIENEFGEVGIDGELIKESGLEVKEINSGCICCSLTGDFQKSIEEIIEKINPSRIIIEPSGVGQLSEIIKACKTETLKNLTQINMLITVVDVERFSLYISNFGEFYKDQIKNARTILLSRTKGISRENIEFVTKEIQKLNIRCNIVSTPWKELDLNSIISLAEKNSINHINRKIKSVKVVREKVKKLNSHKVFQSWGIETPKVFTIDKIKNIIKEFEDSQEYGNVLRAKGVVEIQDNKWIQFNYIPGDLRISEVLPNYNGKLSVIGTNLNREELNKIFSIIE
ncbi:CobW family GTP-binding protein [Tissierella praeacuta]|uniref:CobW family GTP-binding protein n=1 Tax=Tissierella praeacuta TaxID=43131 RepID=UPI001C121919|nr:GTP-binding protein [Tissierella praeacuta]MBU5256292.1 GTP-binding protein [Tissierella praeacuta]